MDTTPSEQDPKAPPTDLIEQLNNQKRKVDFDTFDITVKQLISMVEDKLIDIAPEYQRQFRWKQDRQSVLIESVLLGIPLPSLFMAANKDGTWELVDGVQRLSTLIRFAGSEELRKRLSVGDPLVLESLNKLSTFNSLSFQNLPPPIQIQFQLKPIKIITLSDKSDLQVRFDLFERLNTGGVALTDQEIRACIFRGPFINLLEELAQDPDFRTVVHVPQHKFHDGTLEEYVLRFFAFLYNYKIFEHSVVGFLNEYTAQASIQFDAEKNRSIFKKTFKQLATIFPNGIKRSQSTTPVNLYEAIAVGAGLVVQAGGKLTATKNPKWVGSTDLRHYTTGATNSRKQVASRIEYCAKQLSK